MYKACYMQFMYGGSTVSPYTGDVPTTGYMVGRSDLSETIFVQSVYDPAMGAMDLPQIQVPRNEYTSNLAIAWTIQMSAIKNLKQHTLRSKMYVGTWENKQGSTEVDISQRFKELEDALDKCRLLGEKCVWDLANNEEIYV
tara:strand:+ start:76 stop:498 length:423 start_codon:yes stop_codon:yes gene_type:complete